MSAATVSEMIKKTPGVCGGEACVGDRRIAVWMLVVARRLGYSDERLRSRYQPPLTPAELQAAWDYDAVHRDEIDDAIRRNEQAA